MITACLRAVCILIMNSLFIIIMGVIGAVVRFFISSLLRWLFRFIVLRISLINLWRVFLNHVVYALFLTDS